MDRPRIDELLPHAGNSRYSLTVIAAKRARQINNYYNSLGEGIGVVVPPQVASASVSSGLSKGLIELAAPGSLAPR